MTDRSVTKHEHVEAIELANRLLDAPNCDPDDDLRVLSRQLLRRHEELDSMKRKFGEHPNDGKGLERISKRIKDETLTWRLCVIPDCPNERVEPSDYCTEHQSLEIATPGAIQGSLPSVEAAKDSRPRGLLTSKKDTAERYHCVGGSMYIYTDNLVNAPKLFVLADDYDRADKGFNSLKGAYDSLRQSYGRKCREVERLFASLTRIASDHTASPQFPDGHIYSSSCDACHRQQIAQDALSGDSPPAPKTSTTNQQQLLQDYFAFHDDSLTPWQRRALEDYALWVDDAKPSAPETSPDARDAARYRYIRQGEDVLSPEDEDHYAEMWQKIWLKGCDREKMDAVVDAAMARSSPVETSTPHLGSSIERAFAQSPRRVENNSLKCVSAGCTNDCEKGNPYLCAEHARRAEKAPVDDRDPTPGHLLKQGYRAGKLGDPHPDSCACWDCNK